jgi:hypothetical protein
VEREVLVHVAETSNKKFLDGADGTFGSITKVDTRRD